MSLKSKFQVAINHPSLILDIIDGKTREQIRDKIKRLQEEKRVSKNRAETDLFISRLRRAQSRQQGIPNSLPLNKVCCIEDWENRELKDVIADLQNEAYYQKCNGVLARKPGLIHRKDWEWGLGVIAMRRLGKLNKHSTALGIGAGKELILYYLANILEHVTATDLYDKVEWEAFAPIDFPEHPQKYAPFPYREDSLTVLRMDGTKLELPSESFDIAFSFSSIEHFGGSHHSGALKSLEEMERVLKPGGTAVVATEYIINGKNPPDLTNQFYNKETIYVDFINKQDTMRLVEPLHLEVSARTLDTVLDVNDALLWDTNKFDDDYKRRHPYVMLRMDDKLLTSVMLVLQKTGS